jgi:hypothetical protein
MMVCGTTMVGALLRALKLFCLAGIKTKAEGTKRKLCHKQATETAYKCTSIPKMSLNSQTKKLVTPVRWYAEVSNGEHLSVIHAWGSFDEACTERIFWVVMFTC